MLLEEGVCYDQCVLLAKLYLLAFALLHSVLQGQICLLLQVFLDFLLLDGKESTCNVGDLGSIPRLGRSPRGGHGNPLQYSCLENPMDRGAWWAIVQWVAKELDTTW